MKELIIAGGLMLIVAAVMTIIEENHKRKVNAKVKAFHKLKKENRMYQGTTI